MTLKCHPKTNPTQYGTLPVIVSPAGCKKKKKKKKKKQIMIVEKMMYGCQCDNCGEIWVDEHYGFTAYTDDSSMRNVIADNDTWHTETSRDIPDKHYCPKCFSFNDNDELVIHHK